jgi:SAM-dependent methyltransferase
MPADLRQWRSGTRQNRWYDVLARRIASHRRQQPGAVVDVGAGALELTLSLARRFPATRVEAWDLFADGMERDIPADVSGRIALQRIDLNQLDGRSAPGRTFDIVACVAVIEHVFDPLALLRFLRRITAPGGFAYIVGPEVSAPAHRLLRGNWPYYDPDEHLTLPSLASLERSIALAGGGTFILRRINVRYSLKYLLRFLRVPIPLPSIADFVLPIPAGAFELIWSNDQEK